MPKPMIIPEPVKKQIIDRFYELNGEITIGQLGKDLNISIGRVSQVLTEYFKAKIK